MESIIGKISFDGRDNNNPIYVYYLLDNKEVGFVFDENDSLYWKDTNSRYDFFKLMNEKNKQIPANLLDYQKLYDGICSNLKIK